MRIPTLYQFLLYFLFLNWKLPCYFVYSSFSNENHSLKENQTNLTTKEPEAAVLFEGKNQIRLKLKHDILKLTSSRCK